MAESFDLQSEARDDENNGEDRKNDSALEPPTDVSEQPTGNDDDKDEDDSSRSKAKKAEKEARREQEHRAAQDAPRPNTPYSLNSLAFS